MIETRAVAFTPIKGTRHSVQPDAEFDAHGPLGDRRFCLIDAVRGRVLRTVQHPSLLSVVARLQGSQLSVTLPDGTTVAEAPQLSGEMLTCDYWGRSVELALTTGAHCELLSDHLGQAVRLAQSPRGAIVFGQPLTIVATASIAEVADSAEENGTGAAGHAAVADGERARTIGDTAVADLFHRFRATLLVETDEPFVEETWLGRVMTVRGAVDGLRVRIEGPVPRCAVIDFDPMTGERTGRLLRTLAATRATNRVGEPFFGVYAEVVQHSGC